MEYVATKPKVSKQTQERMQNIESHYFQPIAEFWEDEQAYRKEEFEWRGWISPSAKLHYRMCIAEFFSRIEDYLEFKPKTLRSVRMGTLMHHAFAKQLSSMHYARPLRYDRPDFSNDPEMQEWYQKIQPEIPVWSRRWGFRGKVDEVLRIEGRPAVLDLKTTYMNDARWKELFKRKRASNTYKMQVLIYTNLLNRSGCYPRKIRRCGLAYANMLKAPLSKNSFYEVWFDYGEDERIMTNRLIRAVGEGWQQYKAGEKRIRCTYEKCQEHGY